MSDDDFLSQAVNRNAETDADREVLSAMGSPSRYSNRPASTREGLTMKAAYGKTEEAVAKLTTKQYEVTQEAATEPPFRNKYWDNHEAGLYVDIVSGEPLFASINKFDSSSGWPSFTVPIAPDNLVLKDDSTYGMRRTEVRSRFGDSHLGHIFDDGPEEQGGLRYCINSAALRFIPLDQLEAKGYGEFIQLFAAKETTNEH